MIRSAIGATDSDMREYESCSHPLSHGNCGLWCWSRIFKDNLYMMSEYHASHLYFTRHFLVPSLDWVNVENSLSWLGFEHRRKLCCRLEARTTWQLCCMLDARTTWQLCHRLDVRTTRQLHCMLDARTTRHLCCRTRTTWQLCRRLDARTTWKLCGGLDKDNLTTVPTDLTQGQPNNCCRLYARITILFNTYRAYV